MIILSVICVWHSIAGAIVYSTPSPSSATVATTTTTAVTTPLINSSSAAILTTAASSTACPAYATRFSTDNGRMADRIAMGCLALIYVIFHLVFLFIIFVVVS